MPAATTPPGVRKRRPFSRSTRGCKTCRIRHVKCDETRPACKSCTSTGRTCDGYTTSDSWEIITPVSANKSLGTLPQASKFDDQANASFHYFRAHTISYISGLFGPECEHALLRAGAQDEAVHYAMLAIGNVHKDLERGCGPSTTASTDEWATKQYLKSMRSLTVNKSKDLSVHTDVVLATCILYTCFEALRRNHGAAMKHIQGGLKIVSEFQDHVYSGRNQALIPSKHLIQAFARLEQQLCELQPYTTPKLILQLIQRQQVVGYYDYYTPKPSPVLQFNTFHDAWKGIDQRWHTMQIWIATLPSFDRADPVSVDILNQRDALINDFIDWKNGLDALRKAMTQTLTQREKCISALLDCHFIWAKQILKAATEPGEMLWDQCVDDYAEVIDLCYKVVDAEWRSNVMSFKAFSKNSVSKAHIDKDYSRTWSTSSDSDQSTEREVSASPASSTSKHVSLDPGEEAVPVTAGQRYIPEAKSYSTSKEKEPLLSFVMGIMPILFHIISKCRGARIRLRAINLLEQYPRLEGIWDGLLLAKVARRLDVHERGNSHLEEAAARGALPDEIPSGNRVASFDVVFGVVKREAHVTFSRTRVDPRADPDRIEEIITW